MRWWWWASHVFDGVLGDAAQTFAVLCVEPDRRCCAAPTMRKDSDMRTRNTILTALATALLTAACGGVPASGSGATVVNDDTTAEADGEVDQDVDEATDGVDDGAEEQPASDHEDDEDAGTAGGPSGDEAALGTRDNPLAIGTRIEMGDWSLAVTDVELDATEAVMAENEFNGPPADGRQFVMFSVDATYEGDDSGTAWLDFSWAIAGAGGNTFGGGMDDYCGVIPDPLNDTGETFPGGEVSGNVCISVDADQIEGATIRVEEALSFDDTRAFYALD
jgi:hypothetical protein